MSLWHLIEKQVVARPHAVALVYQEQRLTFLELQQRVAALEVEMLAGVPRHARVLLSSGNVLTVLLRLLAVWRAEGVPLVAHTALPNVKLERMIALARPALLAMDGESRRLAGEPAPPDPNEGILINTSGSTACPRLVLLPWRSLVMNANAIAADLGLTPDDSLLVSTPISHLYGLVGGCLSAWAVGATLHLFDHQLPSPILQNALRKERIRVVQGPPSFYRLFLRYWNGAPFPDVRLVTQGGEACGEMLQQKLRACFPNARIVTVYGMTEAGPRISQYTRGDGPEEADCVGTPFGHFEWKLVPHEDHPGEGLLALRGDALFMGYLNEQGGYERPEREGFFVTNDLFRLGATGKLHLQGRSNRMFKVGGRQVSPEEIESLLLTDPRVANVRCLAQPHEVLGMVPVVEVQPAHGVLLNEKTIFALCEEGLEPYQIPRMIHIVDDIPCGDSGKTILSPPKL